MNVLVNGEERELEAGATVASVVASLPGAPDGRGVAVAVDGLVVRRADWSSAALAPGARIEVVVAVQGG
ncbi:MAG TPA: sulfur carrier protein ThiS [Solirubrobacteraceae bacterium]|jgi:sulfur carrier protein